MLLLEYGDTIRARPVAAVVTGFQYILKTFGRSFAPYSRLGVLGFVQDNFIVRFSELCVSRLRVGWHPSRSNQSFRLSEGRYDLP